MEGRNIDWYDSEDDDEWVWFDVEESEKHRGGKMKSYYIQFKDTTTKSAFVDAVTEREAINQVMEDYSEDKKKFTIISIIQVEEEDGGY